MILSKPPLHCYYGYLNLGRNMVAVEESTSALKVQLMATSAAGGGVNKRDSQV